MQQLSLIILFFSVAFQQLSAQCTPPMAETCEEATLLCTLNELNSYSCTNQSTIPSPCSPICSQGGVGNNTSWWAFMGNGSNVSITLNVGTCTMGQGLEFGIWGNCSCGDEIICRSNPCTIPGNTNTINLTLALCKSYYLWVDGCNGDVCDFTINTSGGGPPVLPPLGKINNVANMIIGPICTGACFEFFVDELNLPCYVSYEWTWEGTIVGGERYLYLDLPNTEGDFTLCVKPKIYNPNSGSYCSEGTPVCATVKLRDINSQRTGLPRTLCWEQASGAGYKWHSNYISTSGTYSQTFSDANCCTYDSIVDFTVLEYPFLENVYHISCDSIPFKDLLGRKYPFCLDKFQLILPRATKSFKCDSTILLTTINADFAPAWKTQCTGGMVELLPNIHILKPCGAGEVYHFEYKWFRKNKPNDILSTDERLMVSAISDDYCLQVTVQTELETELSICTRTFCETFNEGNLAPECLFSLLGSKVFCYDPVAVYQIDSFYSQKVNFYNWTIDGGQIISNPDSSAVEVKWSLNQNDTGKVCLKFNTDCGTSCEKCLTVLFQTKIAGDDFEHRGLSAYLDAKPNPNGIWRLISGPYPVRIEDPTFARTKITANNYGYYCFEWTVNDPDCILKDTLCVNLHNFKKASPEYPKLLFFERAKTSDDKDQASAIVFTPNLIQNNGESFVTIDDVGNCNLNYRWFDIYGRVIIHYEMHVDAGMQKLNINSPIHEGMYFLVIDVNGVTSVRKVCVIE